MKAEYSFEGQYQSAEAEMPRPSQTLMQEVRSVGSVYPYAMWLFSDCFFSSVILENWKRFL